ncbi:ParB/RepB/Spo0J family partition protein [Porticoccaceae bacterium]|nr:ParB/RepB/Spo0J family partition protein [Porticoccaceae bacterium]MDA8652374.1 ParB/RepB/Spo0J family partition protein [Porticoccaceae bacterium]MDA8663483.1 ParB/RepB/Spo0J family partition protein [Porticoccaceae bacterium]MDB2343161.1 ParB/RepB/Spo0J family partition protein [Porticoccaceae bacterium]
MSIDRSHREVPIDLLIAGRYQARKNFGSEEDDSLVEQIKQAGEVYNPIWVVVSGERFEIVAGERRWRCAKLAGIEKLPVIIFDTSPSSIDAAGLGAIENLQRRNLNAIEEARLFQTLIDHFNLTHQTIADRYLPGKKGRTVVSSRLRLLALSEEIQSWILTERLSGKHGEQLLRLDDLVKRKSFARECMKRNWTVKALENAISAYFDPNEPVPNTPALLRVEKKYSSILGTAVKIKSGRSGYNLMINADTPARLEQILSHFDKN